MMLIYNSTWGCGVGGLVFDDDDDGRKNIEVVVFVSPIHSTFVNPYIQKLQHVEC